MIIVRSLLCCVVDVVTLVVDVDVGIYDVGVIVIVGGVVVVCNYVDSYVYVDDRLLRCCCYLLCDCYCR